METLSTLKFGAKCGNIKNQIVVNETILPPPPPPQQTQPSHSRALTTTESFTRRSLDENSMKMPAKRVKLSDQGLGDNKRSTRPLQVDSQVDNVSREELMRYIQNIAHHLN
jgi:hypothetical protein